MLIHEYELVIVGTIGKAGERFNESSVRILMLNTPLFFTQFIGLNLCVHCKWSWSRLRIYPV